MKATSRPKIFIIGLTLLIFSLLSTSGHSGTLYRCVNSKGSVMLTDNVPADPDFKCTAGAVFRDLTPQERARRNREIAAEESERRKVLRAQEMSTYQPAPVTHQQAPVRKSSEPQESRDLRAKRLEAVVDAMVTQLKTEEEKSKWRGAAKIKADEIRKGYQ